MEIIHRLSSKEKRRIIELIKNGVNHPEDIARKMNITRQGVDKHLRELYMYGVVEKYWVVGRKPRMVYNLTSLGMWMYDAMLSLEKDFIRRANGEFKDILRNLDRDFLSGNLSKEDYLARINEEKKRFSWISTKT